jgi:hypothetical protein
MQAQVLQSAGQPVIQHQRRVPRPSPRWPAVVVDNKYGVRCQCSTDNGHMGQVAAAATDRRATTPPVASLDSEIQKQALVSAEASDRPATPCCSSASMKVLCTLSFICTGHS